MKRHIRERSPGKRAMMFDIHDAATRRSSSIDGLTCQIEGPASGWHRPPVARFRHRLLKRALSHAVRWLAACGAARSPPCGGAIFHCQLKIKSDEAE